MIIDSINLYRGTDAAPMAEVSVMIRSMIANSLSFMERFYSASLAEEILFNLEEDREFRVYDC